MNTDKRGLFSHLNAFDFPLCFWIQAYRAPGAPALASVVKAFDLDFPLRTFAVKKGFDL